MPTPYRGRVRIECLREECAIERTKENVGVDCLVCQHSTQAIVDLDGKTVGYLKKPDPPEPATEETKSEKPETAAEKSKKKK